MIGNVAFYSMRGSLSTAEYPLVNGSETPAHTVQNVGYQVGLQTEIHVPKFTGYDTVNVAKIDGQYYWITSFYERTNANGQIFFNLSYMGPTSLIMRGDSITAYLERSPSYICDYLSDDWTKGNTGISNAQPVNDNMTIRVTNNLNQPMYWVQISGVDTDGDYKRYGCFVTVPKFVQYSDPHINERLPSPNGSYPSINDIINNVAEITPFTAETVKDISISRRCPYRYVLATGQGTAQTVVLGISDSIQANPSKNGTGDYLTYDMDYMANVSLALWPKVINQITFTPTTAIRMSGKYIVRDWNKNIIASFPVAEGSTFYVQTFADYSGIYTLITNGKRLMTIPEGKLPYAGSGWDAYQAYSMTADRQALSNAIGYAERERNISAIGGTAEAIANGIMAGAFSGAMLTGPAGAGLGAITAATGALSSVLDAETKYQIEKERLTDNQALTELRAKTAMGSGYNVGYGLVYVTMTTTDDNLIIGPELPLNDSSALLTAYTDRVGYPCEGVHTLTAGNGFYKGYMPASVGSGMYFNELNRVFRQGFKFVTP